MTTERRKGAKERTAACYGILGILNAKATKVQIERIKRTLQKLAAAQRKRDAAFVIQERYTTNVGLYRTPADWVADLIEHDSTYIHKEPE